MKPIDFKERNVILAENQPEYAPLPAWRGPIPECEVISCWKLSIWERIRILFTGVLWLRQLYSTLRASIVNLHPPNTRGYIIRNHHTLCAIMPETRPIHDEDTDRY